MALKIYNIYEAAGVSPLPVPVIDSDASGKPMLTNGHLGVDMLYLPPRYSFPLHTHPGDHLLLTVRGSGTATFGGVVYEVSPGDLYMIEGGVPHAVGSGAEGHWLLAIGAPHKSVDAPDRMTILDDREAHALTVRGT